MAASLTPNMSLLLPPVGVEPGPDWANELNTDISLLDQHDHSSGNGVAITPAGMNITTDLSFQSHNLFALRTTRYTAQGSPLALAADIGCLYVAGVDLYYNDISGNQIRLTQGGSVAGTSGSITNLVSPASVTYVSGTPAFVFQSNVNTSADLDGGSLRIRQNISSANYVQLSSPLALAGSYVLTLPAALPAGVRFLTLDNTGAIGDSYVQDNTTIEVVSNTIQVKDGGITAAKLATDSVTTVKIQDAAVTLQKLVASDYQVSSSSGVASITGVINPVSGLSVTILAVGRPIFIGLVPDSGTPTGYLEVVSTSAKSASVAVYINRDASIISASELLLETDISGTLTQIKNRVPVGGVCIVDVPSAGSHTYTISAARSTGTGNTAFLVNCRLIAYTL